MTSAELESIRQSIPLVTSLFASGTEQTGPQWNDPSDNYAGSRFINWSEGIPPDYAMPYANGGKKVLRKDINAIGNIASRELYLLQHGGYHTFNLKVAKAIGGYPYGAFLDWYQPSTGWLRKVRCVKEGGNCFTPIDDMDHGVESGDAYWVIADIMDSVVGNADNGIVKTEIPRIKSKDGIETDGGSQILRITTPNGQPVRVKEGDVFLSDPFISPFDAMISFNLTYNNVYYYMNGNALKMEWIQVGANLYRWRWALEDIVIYDTAPTNSYMNFVEVSDDSGSFRINYHEILINPSEHGGYQSGINRMFIKKGTQIRLGIVSRTGERIFFKGSEMRFSVSEVL